MTLNLSAEAQAQVADVSGPLSSATAFPITVSGNRLCNSDVSLARSTELETNTIDLVCKQWEESVFGIAAGYTYLGQFLAHEIVSREGHSVQRSWKLDLDSVYGTPLSTESDDVAELSALVKDAEIDAEGRFTFTRPIPNFSKDLRRQPFTHAQPREALIPEFRNDDQLIIAQLHLLIQLFHNRVLGAIKASAKGKTLTPVQQFVRARRYVVATLQRIYWEEYLPECAIKEVYTLAKNGLQVFNVPDTAASLPLEITHAALRFGHSQIRLNYDLHRTTSKSLAQLFALTGLHGKADFVGVPADSEIDWRFFFPWTWYVRKVTPQSGLRINPKIVDPMTALPEVPSNIILRNLKASYSKALPSGQHVAESLAGAVPSLEISAKLPNALGNEAQKKILLDRGLWKKTPLWLYVLLEASECPEGGLRLGRVGSVLLCETIRNVLSTGNQFTYEKVLQDSNGDFELPQLARMEQLITFTEPEKYSAVLFATPLAGLFINVYSYLKRKLT